MKNDVIPISSGINTHHFEIFVSKIRELSEIADNPKQFKQEFEAIEYWVSDSCRHSDVFLDVYLKFEKQIKRKL